MNDILISWVLDHWDLLPDKIKKSKKVRIWLKPNIDQKLQELQKQVKQKKGNKNALEKQIKVLKKIQSE